MLVSFAKVRLPFMRKRWSHIRRMVVLGIVCSWGVGAIAAQEEKPAERKGVSPRVEDPWMVPKAAPRSSAAQGDGLPPQLICFPPNPTVLVREFSQPLLPPTPPRLAPLAPHVGEYYYAPLSSRLLHRRLSVRMEKRLGAHTARKAELLAEIRACMQELVGRPAEERTETWRELAAAQSVRLGAVELEAEKLRRELLRGAVWGRAGSDWFVKRQWRLGRGPLDRPRAQNLIFEYQVLRACAYYQAMISTAWRRLMHETAIEIEAAVFAEDISTQFEADPFVFFSPDLSRVLPPRGFESLFSGYTEGKAALKRDLRDAIYAAEGAKFGSERDRLIVEFTRQNESRRVALEQQAEAIRLALAGSEMDELPAGPVPLAPEIETRIAALQAATRRIEVALISRLAAVTKALPARPGDDPGSAAYRDWTDMRMEATRRAEGEFYHERREELQKLAHEADALRSEIEAVVGPQPDLGRGRGFDAFIADFLTQRRQQTSHRDYHAACFEPGLSLTQRWLLFEAAMIALELPLPEPELQPREMPETMLR